MALYGCRPTRLQSWHECVSQRLPASSSTLAALPPTKFVYGRASTAQRPQGPRTTSADACPPDNSIIRIDALLNATRCTVEDVGRIVDRYPGARGIRRLRAALDLADGGAESPKETELRLLLVRDGLARPTTQIKVGKRRIDMGWPQWKVGVEYDGEHHWTNPDDYAEDIERLEFLASQGWIIVRVSGRQLHRQPQEVIRRVRDALARRGYPLVSVN